MSIKNTLYYEKYQTTDLAFFLHSTQQTITIKKLLYSCFIHIFLSIKNNNYQQ
jgi:hypothetical protein